MKSRGSYHRCVERRGEQSFEVVEHDAILLDVIASLRKTAKDSTGLFFSTTDPWVEITMSNIGATFHKLDVLYNTIKRYLSKCDRKLDNSGLQPILLRNPMASQDVRHGVRVLLDSPKFQDREPRRKMVAAVEEYFDQTRRSAIMGIAGPESVGILDGTLNNVEARTLIGAPRAIARQDVGHIKFRDSRILLVYEWSGEGMEKDAEVSLVFVGSRLSSRQLSRCGISGELQLGSQPSTSGVLFQPTIRLEESSKVSV